MCLTCDYYLFVCLFVYLFVYLCVCFGIQDGSVVHFKIKRNTPLKKLMQAYCDRQVSYSGV